MKYFSLVRYIPDIDVWCVVVLFWFFSLHVWLYLFLFLNPVYLNAGNILQIVSNIAKH